MIQLHHDKELFTHSLCMTSTFIRGVALVALIASGRFCHQLWLRGRKPLLGIYLDVLFKITASMENKTDRVQRFSSCWAGGGGGLMLQLSAVVIVVSN
jgi:hypothetical protein